MTEKRCSGCMLVLPATPKYFWRRVYEVDGLRKRCKQCCKETPGYIRRMLP